MRLHQRDGVRGVVIDLDTGRRVPKVIWVDVEKGELEAYQVEGPEGRETVKKDAAGDYLTYQARGRFRLINLSTPSARPKYKLGAPLCVVCKSPFTLPGEDRCVSCKSKDRGKGPRAQASRLTPQQLLEAQPCDHKGCNRPAAYAVSDEVQASPVKGTGGWGPSPGTYLFERATMVGQRLYCEWHYLPPRELDEKGEVVGVDHEAGGVRPT